MRCPQQVNDTQQKQASNHQPHTSTVTRCEKTSRTQLTRYTTSTLDIPASPWSKSKYPTSTMEIPDYLGANRYILPQLRRFKPTWGLNQSRVPQLWITWEKIEDIALSCITSWSPQTQCQLRSTYSNNPDSGILRLPHNVNITIEVYNSGFVPPDGSDDLITYLGHPAIPRSPPDPTY